MSEPRMEVWVLGWRSGPWIEGCVLEGVWDMDWLSGSWNGSLDHGWTSRPPIQDRIQGLKSGLQNGLLGPGMKVWNPDVSMRPNGHLGPGLSSGLGHERLGPGWRFGSWDGNLGRGGRLYPGGKAGSWDEHLGPRWRFGS